MKEKEKEKPSLPVEANPSQPAISQPADIDSIKAALIEHGDYSKLDKDQKQALLVYLCNQNGLDPSTRPFGFLNLLDKKTGKARVVLYAYKSAADGIAKSQKLADESMEIIDLPGGGAIYKVSVVDQDWIESGGKKGRRRFGIGVVPPGLQGLELANAHKKAETQAHRRAILSMSCPGVLDESEIQDIPDAVPESEEARIEKAKPAEAKATKLSSPGRFSKGA